MNTISRIRRSFKWTGAGLLVLILVVWMVSQWRALHVIIPGNRLYFSISSSVTYVGAASQDARRFIRPGVSSIPEPFSFCRPRVESRNTSGQVIRWVEIPHWLAFILVAIPTACMWHRDRQSGRIPPGCCPRCGYDLTGNTTGVCSECGECVNMKVFVETASTEPRHDLKKRGDHSCTAS